MKRTLFVLIGVAMLWFALPASAQSNFEFKGIKLGMSIQDLHSSFPNFFCDEQGPQTMTCTDEHGDGDAKESYVLNVFDGKVARANIWLSATKYREAKDSLLKQFGKPTNKNLSGDKKKSEVLTWMRTAPSSLLVVEQSTMKDPALMSVMMNDDGLIAQMGKAK
jgi:hypothetical protein